MTEKLIIPKVLVQSGQVVEARGDRGMLWPERLLPDRQGSLVERFGLGVAALDFVGRSHLGNPG